jgi:hypothetical protein
MFLDRIGAVIELADIRIVIGLGRRFEDRAVIAKQPTVVATADSALFDFAEL